MVGRYKLMLGDCLKRLPELDDNSVDSVVTDPPYGLSFMGKDWDHGVPGVHFWEEILRVCKPGGYLLAFGGTRTHHRLMVAIEDAGWEIRDVVMWVYGSGFPKSHNISKAIDKAAGVEREVVGSRNQRFGLTQATGWNQTSTPRNSVISDTAPATPEAQQWDGWGTALKPAWEPIIVARKPLEGTVAQNVLEYGTGGMNIDRSRIPLNGDYKCGSNGRPSQTGLGDNYKPEVANQHSNVGRWPANLIHDGSDEATAPLGEAARFFYCAKASKSDRGEGNNHPTVKPTALMRYLVRLVTQPNGIILDPFMGSGSTGKAAMLEGFRFIGIELDKNHKKIAKARIVDAKEKRVKV